MTVFKAKMSEATLSATLSCNIKQIFKVVLGQANPPLLAFDFNHSCLQR